MSENLKRAESLFNRIMNQNGSSSSSASTTASTNNISGGNDSSNGKSHHQSNRSYNNNKSYKSNNHSHSHNHNHNHHHNNASNNSNNYSSTSVSNSSSVSTIANQPLPPTTSSNGPSEPATILPNRDPIKLSQEIVSGVPQDHHLLEYCWTVWHHSRNKVKVQHRKENEEPDNSNGLVGSVDSYLQTTNEVKFINANNKEDEFEEGEEKSITTTSIASLEQLWISVSSIKKCYELSIGTDILIFKSGINPVWEDPINTKGGRWIFRFRRAPTNEDKDGVTNIRKRTSLIWERLLIKTLTGSIIPINTNVANGGNSSEIQELLLNDISGLVLSVRRDEDIISIWNSNLSFNGSSKNKKEDSTVAANSKKLTSFQARRIICDSIIRVIRECDLIKHGSNSISTLDSGSNERVNGVSFEYRLHVDINGENGEGDKSSLNSSGNNGSSKYNGGNNGGHYQGHGHGHSSYRRYNRSSNNNNNNNNNHNRDNNNNNNGNATNATNTTAASEESG